MAVTGNAQITLQWTAPSGASSYNIKRSTINGGPYTTVATGVTPVTYTNTGLTNGTAYFYVVSAVNTAGESANSSQAGATPIAPPFVPTGLVATTGNAQVSLQWTAPSGAVSYNVKRSTTSGGPYTAVVTGLTAVKYTDTGLTNGPTYYYVVSAVNAGGESANSNQAAATPVAPPLVPTGLVAAASDTKVTLQWTAASGAASYNLKRSTTSGGPYITVAPGLTAVNCTDTIVTNGITYYYVVSAVNAGGESANSTQVVATPVAPPLVPIGVGATAGNAQVALQWIAPSGAATYNVKRSTTNGGPYTAVATGVTAVTYTDTGLTNGTAYYYVVSAVNAAGESANSPQAGATPIAPPLVPTGLLATIGNAQVTLQWTAPSGAASYNVKRSTTSGGPYASVATGVTAVTYADTGLINGTAYYYVVSAVNAGGESADSTQAGATPIPLPLVPTGLLATAGNAQVTLQWTASSGAASYKIKRSTTSGGPYSAVATGITAVTYTDTGLTNGTAYYYVVSAVNVVGESANSTQAGATPIAPPVAPTGLSAAAGNAQVALQWTAPGGASSYNIKRSATSGGPYTTVATGITAVTYTDPGLANGTAYYYVVSAVNAGGESANSTQAGATTLVLPLAPTGLVATTGNAQVTLQWTASSGAASYNIKRSTTSGGPYASVATGVTVVNYTDTGLTNGTAYYYVVSAVNVVGESANSTQAGTTPIALPLVPTGLLATAGNAQVTLQWTASSGAASYKIKRSTTSGGPYSAVATGITAVNYTDTGLTNGTAYYYVVSAVNAVGESANSTQAGATPIAPPVAPAGLSAAAGNAQVALQWTAPGGASSYNIKRSATSGGPYTAVATGITTVNYTDTGLANGTAYYYVVSAVNAGGESANSAQAGATTLVLPLAPTGLVAATGNAQVALQWTASSGAASYNIKRSTTDGGPYASVATGVTAVNYTDTGLTNGTAYYYVVSAVNAVGESANSTQAGATPIALPLVPTGLVATTGNAQVTLQWTAPSGAASYKIKRSTTSGGPYATVATGVTAVTYVNTGLTNGTAYYYVVSAVNAVGESANSTQAGATPIAPPVAPTGLSATAGNAQVALQWTAPGGASSYNIKRSATSGGPYTTVATGITAATYTDTGLPNGATYYYVVSATNAVGESADSTQAGATTPVLPLAPTGLVAAAGNSQVTLQWTASNGAVSYNIKRSTTDGGPYASVANGVSAVNYTNTGLTNGTAYYYVVSAVNTVGESANSTQAGATPIAPPLVPTGLVATAGNAQVTLQWTAPTGAASYNIKRSTTSGGPYTAVATGVTAVTYVNTGLINGTAYFYVVSAVNAVGESANSTQAGATPVGPPPVPTGLVATSGNAQIALQWTASAGASSYNVKRSTTSGGPYTTVATGVTAASYTNTGLTNGTPYYYVVSAVNTVGESANSTQAGATPIVPLPVPTGLVATAGNAQVTLQWTAPGGAASYNIKRSTTSGGPYTTVATGVITASYANTGLATGTAYYYVVSAVSAAGESANSAEANATPLAGLPSPWTNKDVGAVGAPGAAAYSNGTFSIDGSGANIAGWADEFQFVYQTATGDCSIVARIATIENTSPKAKVGIMIRETTLAKSRYAGVLLRPSGILQFARRTTTGGYTAAGKVTGITAPSWLKLTRTGNIFNAYYSANGTTWTPLGAGRTVVMGKTVSIGLAVCSHVDRVLCTSTMDSVTASP